MRRILAIALVVSFASSGRSARAEWEPLPDPPIVFDASRTDVWKAVTTAQGIAALEGGVATVDLRPGGTIRRHADPTAEADAEGWTSRSVLAFVAPRLLLLGDETPATWTVIEFDELDSRRTRMRIEHVGVVAGSKAATMAEAEDRGLVARLEKRFPKQPDAVIAALTPLVGTWEERADGRDEVVARWTIAVEAGVDDQMDPPSVSLLRTLIAGDGSEHWVYWKDAESGRWVGGLVEGARAAGWEIGSGRDGSVWLSNRWAERATYIQPPQRDGSVKVGTSEGCCGGALYRWTRATEAR